MRNLRMAMRIMRIPMRIMRIPMRWQQNREALMHLLSSMPHQIASLFKLAQE